MAIASVNEIRQAINGIYEPTVEDKVRKEQIARRRRAASEPRQPLDNVMIVDRTGATRDIKTGRPPTMKKEAREAWERAREEASIDKLFR